MLSRKDLVTVLTDDQIRALRGECLADHRPSMIDTCDVALGRYGESRRPSCVAKARARCAEILNRRSAHGPSKKGPQA